MTMPLFETQADVIIQKQNKRIAALEEEKQVLIEQHNMWKQQWHELNYSLVRRDLEMKAEGIEDAINNSPSRLNYSLPLVATTELYSYMIELRQQAKELK